MLLHVGHGKTGSSFLQAALANSPEALAAHGLGYPIDPEVAENARRGGISSGNMAPSARALQSALEQGWEGPQDTLLISSESFFYKMRLKGFPRSCASCCQMPRCRCYSMCATRWNTRSPSISRG